MAPLCLRHRRPLLDNYSSWLVFHVYTLSIGDSREERDSVTVCLGLHQAKRVIETMKMAEDGVTKKENASAEANDVIDDADKKEVVAPTGQGESNENANDAVEPADENCTETKPATEEKAATKGGGDEPGIKARLVIKLVNQADPSKSLIHEMENVFTASCDGYFWYRVISRGDIMNKDVSLYFISRSHNPTIFHSLVWIYWRCVPHVIIAEGIRDQWLHQVVRVDRMLRRIDAEENCHRSADC